MQTITLIPLRKNCPSLPGTMTGVLMSLPGVEKVVVGYDARSLTITFDPTKVSPALFIEKIGAETGLAMRVDDTSAHTASN